MINFKGITIDSAGSRDLDDAIWVEQRGDSYRVIVLVTLVSDLVAAESDIDKRAMAQAFSRYRVASCVEPMLPREISEDQGTLKSGSKRSVVALGATLNREFEVEGYGVEIGQFTNRNRLSHAQAEAVIEDESHPLNQTLSLAKTVAYGLLSARRASGALAFYDVTKGLMTTEEGFVVAIEGDKASTAHIIVQELMIMANRLLAEYLIMRDYPCLFRNHQPRSSAPPVIELAKEIEMAISHHERFDLQTLNQRLALTATRACYEPVLGGHYGLNLPAYAHFTSPLRRYSDLVNQRTLLAAINGLPAPYNKEQLTAIAATINEAFEADKESKRDAFYQGAQRKSQVLGRNLMRSGTLHTASDGDFYRILKTADQLPPEELSVFEQDLIRRASEGDLGLKTWAVIVIKHHALLSLETREALIQALHGNLSVLPSLVSVMEQKYQCPKPALSSSQVSLTPSVWAAAGQWQLEASSITHSVEVNGGKGQAEHLAILGMLAKLWGVELREANQTVAATASVASENYKGRLFEKCQKLRISPPVISVVSSGPSHAPVFVGSGSMTVDGESYAMDSEPVADKKSAQQMVCKALLENVTWPVKAEAAIASGSLSGKNPISALQEYCQKLKLGLPQYDYAVAADGFECRVVVNREGRDLIGVAEGPRKAAAKERAARELVDQLI